MTMTFMRQEHIKVSMILLVWMQNVAIALLAMLALLKLHIRT